MVSPISALTSRAPSVRALSRVSQVTAKAEAVEEETKVATATAAKPPPPPGPGLRDALPAGYRNFAMPLGAESDGPLAGENAPLRSAYGPSAAALSGLPRLIGERIPPRIVIREAQTALRAAAEARGETVREFLDAAETVPRARLPSRNSAEAAPTIRAALLVRDGERDTATIDLYVTKTGPGAVEAAAYDRDFASPSGGFPYAAPPLFIDRINFDPAYQAVVSAVASPPRRRSAASGGGASPVGSIIVTTVIGVATFVAVMLTLAAGQPVFAATIALLGAMGFVYTLRARSA
ncbi:hypothetical protein MSC49_06260 [Methylosinus sp. C49]|uniref:hypothetical protein n=1 Tax=Methylosinus sp. C49 TaxID=2699395 RepID=UPI001366C650|nr:hypothetical protein [Methylosinus sp. C49]BBU60691.1 hypothetical protein MSC49_06260 [Methylosinus sp. C49]